MKDDPSGAFQALRLDGVVDAAVERCVNLYASRDQLERWADRLSRVSPEHAELFVRNAPLPCEPWAAAWACLERAKVYRQVDSSRHLTLARAAVALAEKAGRRTIRVRALAELGNCHRHRGALYESALTFRRAERHLQEYVDPAVEGEFYFLRSLTRDARRQLPAAWKDAVRAERIFEELELQEELARTYLAKGGIRERQGKFKSASEEFERALTAARAAGLPRLEFGALHSLIWVVGEAMIEAPRARVRHANRESLRRLIVVAPPLYKRFGQETERAKLLWLWGRASVSGGNFADGDGYLKEARSRFEGLAQPVSVALVRLDEATSMALQGRLREAKTQCRKVQTELAALGVESELRASHLLSLRIDCVATRIRALRMVLRGRVETRPRISV